MKLPNRVLILPNIRSCHNVGAMFRTADACGFDKLYLVGYTPHPPKPQIDKVSLGAETWIPWEASDSLESIIATLRDLRYQIIALEKTAKITSIIEFYPEKNVALIVGNEVEGVLADTLRLCDAVVHIPMVGKKESLNVSIAAGIAMYTLAEKMME